MADMTTSHPTQEDPVPSTSSSSLEFRRRVYVEELWVEGSPEPPQSNPHCMKRLLPWLQRELEALLLHQGDQMRLLAAILWELSRGDLRLVEFTDTVRRHLGPWTSHFLHEFLGFSTSSLSMERYDQTAMYSLGTLDVPGPSQLSPPSALVSLDEEECQVLGIVRPRSPVLVDLTGNDDPASSEYSLSPHSPALPPNSPTSSTYPFSQTLPSPTRSLTSHESWSSPEYHSPIHSLTFLPDSESHLSTDSLTSCESWTSSDYHSPTHSFTFPSDSDSHFSTDSMTSSREHWTSPEYHSPTHSLTFQSDSERHFPTDSPEYHSPIHSNTFPPDSEHHFVTDSLTSSRESWTYPEYHSPTHNSTFPHAFQTFRQYSSPSHTFSSTPFPRESQFCPEYLPPSPPCSPTHISKFSSIIPLPSYLRSRKRKVRPLSESEDDSTSSFVSKTKKVKN